MQTKTVLAAATGLISVFLMMLATHRSDHVRAALLAEHETLTICHIPSGATMEIPVQALDGHMKHGDYLGPCESSSSSAASSEASSDQSSADSSVESSVTTSEPPNNSSSSEHHMQETAPAESHNIDRSGGANTPVYPLQPVFRGHGITEHAAVVHFVLQSYGLHEQAPYSYTFNHENIRPALFASAETEAEWTLRDHAQCCSMYRYLKRLQEERPYIQPGYIAWITGQVAQALGEDEEEIKAALLGYPHEHPHTNGFIRSITEAGCAENPYMARTQKSHSSQESGFRIPEEHIHAAPTDEGSDLRVEDVSSDGELAFRVMDGDEVFTDYGITHTKEMHLLLMRSDLRYFHHLHPERDENGIWHVPFIPPAGGTYWIYADFVDRENQGHTFRFEKPFDGDTGPEGILTDARMAKYVGKYFVRLEAESYDHGTLFTYHLRDIYGKSPHLESYLGAMGHGILISSEGDFVHTHPSAAGDTLTFHISNLARDFYRIYTQFQIDGEVLTVEFDWMPENHNRE